MNTKIILLISLFCLATSSFAQDKEISLLSNPMSVDYLKNNLRKSQPRLVLNSTIEKGLKEKIKTDPVVKNMFAAVKLNAKEAQTKPLLERKLEGRRLLGVSREMLWRMNSLCMLYRIEKDAKILARINEEVIAVCNFSDWNPSHFLDVAEMSLAVALAVDWTAGELPKSTQDLAIKALIEKGIKPSWPENGESPGWANGNSNWNQVCNGGMIAASIVIAEIEPELAAKTLKRALDGLPHALAEYGPDGVYQEGSTYWAYGTGFSVITAAMLESAFGSDFGHFEYPAFKESAVFRSLANAPSGWYYNFGDCGDKRSKKGDIVLAWFASKTGNKTFFEKERFLRPAKDMGKLHRISGAALAWIAQYEEKESAILPTAWKGEGANPIVFFTGDKNDSQHYYFGGKGGSGSVNHGNMDGGSFVFELNGVRWVVDPGNQNYHDLEKTGFDLWDKCQECERWTLLTKNNFGHSTLTVNKQLHKVDGVTKIIDFKKGMNPSATFDLSAAFEGQLKSAKRTFIKDSPSSLIIEDEIEASEKTRIVTWQLMTISDVEIVEGGAIFFQDGKKLKLENLSHPEFSFSIVSLYPAPLKLDRQIEGLKRVELNIPVRTIKAGQNKIKIRLTEI